MRQRITPSEARAFKARWRLVNQVEREELRSTSIGNKMRQLAALMASGRALGWAQPPAEDEAEVWERWQRLRKAYRVG